MRFILKQRNLKRSLNELSKDAKQVKQAFSYKTPNHLLYILKKLKNNFEVLDDKWFSPFACLPVM
jgi:hypothetical protein